MTTSDYRLEVAGIPVRVVRKPIKNLHLGVYPPDGRVRVSAPARLPDDAIRLAVATRLPWIRQRQRRLTDQARQSRREMVSGESHYVRGIRHRLRVVHGPKATVRIHSGNILELTAPLAASPRNRERILHDWHRENLRSEIPSLLGRWEKRVGVRANEWRIKRMKTRWGTCSREAGRIWLNLELAKKPVQCLEYIVVHELVHLLEPKHGERFVQLMDAAMPHWREIRALLNDAPLAFENWTY